MPMRVPGDIKDFYLLYPDCLPVLHGSCVCYAPTGYTPVLILSLKNIQQPILGPNDTIMVPAKISEGTLLPANTWTMSG